MSGILLVALIAILLIAIVLVIVGFRSPRAADPLQSRLAEFASRDTPVTLEEIELSQPFSERILLPLMRTMGQFASRFTPQATLEDAQRKLDLAGNPRGLGPTEFVAIRIGLAIFLGVMMFLAFTFGPGERIWTRILGLTLLSVAFGYFMPQLYLSSKISRRQHEIIKALPDALDLLTICVQAGLGFDAAMNKVAEKWDNELSIAFHRVIQEVRLGKVRREALRDMADRMDVADVTSFIAAVIQAEQLGVSLAKILRIQSDQMRVRRRQRAEEQAHKAPIKMLFPMAIFIFPTIYIVLLGPAGIILLNSVAAGILF
ncbi:MAG: type II secretion system F family protein [Anaerolineales bacterium]